MVRSEIRRDRQAAKLTGMDNPMAGRRTPMDQKPGVNLRGLALGVGLGILPWVVVALCIWAVLA